MSLVDSHCHLDILAEHAGLDDLNEIVADARKAGVSRMLCVSVDLNQFTPMVALADAYPEISFSVGLHPTHEVAVEPVLSDYLPYIQHPRVVAVGETGLDYYREPCDRELQKVRFKRQIDLAKTFKKPLIVHTRSAKEDTLAMLREENAADVGGVLHCFTEDWTMAEAAMNLNFFISFSGIVTFKNAKAIQEVAQRLPLDKMLIETDSPYLAPVPHRGKTNIPAYVTHVAAFIAELRGITAEEVAQVTTDNFERLFMPAHQ